MGNESLPPPDVIASGFSRLIDDLRDDVREDLRDIRSEIKHSEERVTARVASVEARQIETREQLVEFARSHGDEHEQYEHRSAENHTALWEAFRRFEINEARRDGALGIIRYLVELTSRHAQRIAAIILALAATVGFASGGITVGIGQ
jgi:hypothetical protein